MPVRLISSVRGIGVAVSVSTSTSAVSCLIASLWLHAEALLLVDDEQAEVLERDVVRTAAGGCRSRSRPRRSAARRRTFGLRRA